MKHGSNPRRGRSRGNGKRHPSALKNSYESNGPDVKVRGTAQQVLEKYLALARDATASGDRIAAEAYFQFAEHYYRLIHTAEQAQQQQRANQQQNQGRSRGPGQGDDGDDMDDDGPMTGPMTDTSGGSDRDDGLVDLSSAPQPDLPYQDRPQERPQADVRPADDEAPAPRDEMPTSVAALAAAAGSQADSPDDRQAERKPRRRAPTRRRKAADEESDSVSETAPA
ncbi:MAG: DUF4167 domain-containing protein [Rhodobacterales bacterium]|nr:DUF4167 domain-containing protein [Rhodobacterales bacterium]